MSDLFHRMVPHSYRAAVFSVMAACPQHTFIVVTKRPGPNEIPWRSAQEANDSTMGYARRYRKYYRWPAPNFGTIPWPLPNVHILVSAEDQHSWDQRVPLLLDMPAAVRGVSAEPLLESIEPHWLEKLDWLVVGGESGRGARHCNTEWLRSLRTHATRDGIPIFVKQLGSNSIGSGTQIGKGNDMATWPEYLRVREFPRGETPA